MSETTMPAASPDTIMSAVTEATENLHVSASPVPSAPPLDDVAAASPPPLPTITSNLSVDAKEFVPRSRGISFETLPLNEVKEFVPRSQRPVAAETERAFPEFVPRNQMRQDFTPQPVETDIEPWDDYMGPTDVRRGPPLGAEAAVRDLTETMDHVAIMPESFERVAAALADAFVVWMEDDATAIAVVDALFERAVTDANFRFSGVRLCVAVDKLVGNTFRTRLLTRCAKEHLDCVSAMPAQGQRARGYAMLVSDLYVSLEVVPGTRARVDILGRATLEALAALLDRGQAEDVKCTCDALKLAGHTLSAFDQPSVDALFLQLQKISSDNTTPATVQTSIDKVTNLRRENWGLGTGQPASVTPATAPVQSTGNGPVFYGPDGNVLTPEEREFLQENTTPSLDMDDSFTFQDTIWEHDVVMNAEVQAAYEQFCRLGKD